MDVFDRVKTPEPAEYSSPLLSYSGMDVRLSSVRSGRRLLGAAGRDLSMTWYSTWNGRRRASLTGSRSTATRSQFLAEP
jgi:hypothetical protein